MLHTHTTEAATHNRIRRTRRRRRPLLVGPVVAPKHRGAPRPGEDAPRPGPLPRHRADQETTR